MKLTLKNWCALGIAVTSYILFLMIEIIYMLIISPIINEL